MLGVPSRMARKRSSVRARLASSRAAPVGAGWACVVGSETERWPQPGPQVDTPSASPTDRLCSAETTPLQFRCSADPFPAVLSGFRRSLSLPEKARRTGLCAGKSLCFALRGTQESNLTLRFWRPPCYRYTSPPRAVSLMAAARRLRQPGALAGRLHLEERRSIRVGLARVKEEARCPSQVPSNWTAGASMS
jgi:hypothetical protein